MLPEQFIIQPEVSLAINNSRSVVALETAVITHGLPFPKNLELAAQMEAVISNENVLPATIGILNGKIHIGLTPAELEHLATTKNSKKISRKDFGLAAIKGLSGGTTVAGTMIAAHLAGIKVFATGGIGGVHRESTWDISADLPELARTPMVVVCAGAKAILDLPATMEYLETQGVTVVGYQTDEFPAFYSQKSGIKLEASCNTPAEIASIAKTQWGMGIKSAILVVQPIPAEYEIPFDLMNEYIHKAVHDAHQAHIYGPALTPFLLNLVAQLSGGESISANIALLKNNALLAARISKAFEQSTAGLII